MTRRPGFLPTACALGVLFFPYPMIAATEQPGTDSVAFRVEDAISWTKLAAFMDIPSSSSDRSVALFSPDGSQFLLHTLRGDLQKNVNVERLLQFAVSDVNAFLRTADKGGVPQPLRSIEIETRPGSGSMADIRWLDDFRVGFTAEDANGRRQVFTADLRTGSVSQRSDSKTGVLTFDGRDTSTIFYQHAPAPGGAVPLVRVATDQTLGDLIFPEPATDTPLELFIASSRDGESRRIEIPPRRLLPLFQKLWLSPDGRHAITFTPAINAPDHWAEYRIPFFEMFGYTAQRRSADPTSDALLFRTRYELIDIATGKAHPLFDAPSGALTQNGTPLEAFWIDGGRSVILSNSYLPLRGVAPGTVEQRRSRPAIVEFVLATGEIRLIAWEPVITPEQEAQGEKLQPIVSVDWDESSRTLSVEQMTPEGRPVPRPFRRDHSTWKEGRGTTLPRGTAMTVARHEDLNEPPRVVAAGGRCRCEKVLFDPNPQAATFAFGRAEVIEWTDANGHAWRGQLILPPGYKAGTRYPLVVQTHGFRAHEFLIDGPYGLTTAMAARPLSAAGIVVLQVEDNVQAMTLDEREGPFSAEGIRAGIAHIVEAGIADVQKVGVIGFSRTGYYVLHLLALHPNLLAAATIADSLQQGYVSDVFLVNQPADVSSQVRSLSGGAAVPGKLGEWIERNPMYKLQHTSTAVRLEAIGPGSVLGLWETLAVLRNAGRAADFIYFPAGEHVLLKPVERMGSQDGNVDWFRFWLQDYEDQDPAKQEQYRRWRALRELQVSGGGGL